MPTPDSGVPTPAMIVQPTPLDVLVAGEGGDESPIDQMVVIGWAPGPDEDHPVLPVAVPYEGSAAPRVIYEPRGFRRPA